MHNQVKRFGEDNSRGVKFLLFLISPLLSLLYSLKSLEKKSSLVYVFLFCVFFGLAFSVSNIRTPGSPDGVAYRAVFEDYSTVNQDEFMLRVSEYFSFQTDIKDLYSETVAFVVSRFTTNYHVFFLVIAIIFAFFQLKTLTFLTRHRNYVGGTVCLLLVFLFTYVQIKNINGLRFWTAYWIACYALFNLFINRNSRFLIIIGILPFFHVSFVVVWPLVGLYYLTGKLETLWFVILFVSLFVGNLSLALIQESAVYLPPSLSRFVDYYTNEEIVSKVGTSGSGFYLLDRIFPILVNIYMFIMLLLVIRERKRINSRQTRNLMMCTIILVSFSNFMMPVPSLGGRFFAFSYPLVAYLWLDIIGTTKYKSFILFMPVVFFMAIYHLLQSYWENVDKLFYISSPFVDIIRFL